MNEVEFPYSIAIPDLDDEGMRQICKCLGIDYNDILVKDIPLIPKDKVQVCPVGKPMDYIGYSELVKLNKYVICNNIIH